MSGEPESPSAEELQRELEGVRAASPPLPPQPAQPAVREALLKKLRLGLILWVALIVMFLVIWQVLQPGK